jgi:hypothetical protein
MKIALYKVLIRPDFLYSRRYYLGFAYLVAYLQKFNPEVECRVCFTPMEVKQFKPDVVGISSATEVWPLAVKETLSHLCRGRFGNLQSMQGICYYDDTGNLIKNPSRKSLVMDELPEPVLYTNEKPALSTVRGCFYKCYHCVECFVNQGFRFLSAERLVDLMINIYEKTGISDIDLLDDLFIVNRQRPEKLKEEMKRRGVLGKFRLYKVSLRAELIDRDVLKTLREIGVVDSGIGIESVNDRILNIMKHGRISKEMLKKVINMTNDVGLPLGGSIVLGFPGETEEEMRETIEFIMEANKSRYFSHWAVYVCQPLPGSDYWFNSGLDESVDFSTLRIDADTTFFSTDWYFGNHTMSKEKFVSILDEYGLKAPGHWEIRKPVDVKPHFLTGWLERVNQLADEKKIDDAIQTLKDMMKVNPSYYQGNLYLAKLLKIQGRNNEIASIFHELKDSCDQHKTKQEEISSIMHEVSGLLE